MAHPHHHAVNSARKFGGAPDDCLAVHSWFDATKAHLATPAHRALRHHTAGIFEAEATFGTAVTNSAGRAIPTRFIGEQHVLEDCRRIPTPADWLRRLPVEPWMVFAARETPATGDARADWQAAVAAGHTTLGLADWIAAAEMKRRD